MFQAARAGRPTSVAGPLETVMTCLACGKGSSLAWEDQRMPTMENRHKRKRPNQDRATDAYQKLRDVIVRGKLAPGARIVESEVADRLGVSRTPVRSALQRLQQEGYVITPDGGRQSRAEVAPVTKDDGWELFNIVGEVEGLAARWAAALPQDARAGLADELEDINRSLLAEIEKGSSDHQRIFELDTGFHRRYVEAAARPRLRALHEAIKPQADRYIWLYISTLVDLISTSVEEHEASIRAIAMGDPDIAQRRVQTNWRNAADRLTQGIEVAGELGSW